MNKPQHSAVPESDLRSLPPCLAVAFAVRNAERASYLAAVDENPAVARALQVARRASEVPTADLSGELVEAAVAAESAKKGMPLSAAFWAIDAAYRAAYAAFSANKLKLLLASENAEALLTAVAEHAAGAAGTAHGTIRDACSACQRMVAALRARFVGGK